jgi:hypothetical protein
MAEWKKEKPLEWPDDHSGALAHDHYAAIGRVATEWAAFETTLDSSTLLLARFEIRRGVCLTAQIAGWSRKFDAYVAIARLRGATKTIPDLNKFAQDTNGLSEQRNRVVHDPWVGKEKPHRLETTAKRTLRFEFVPVPTVEVMKIAGRITDHIKRFEKLNLAVVAELKALHGKPPPASP